MLRMLFYEEEAEAAEFEEKVEETGEEEEVGEIVIEQLKLLVDVTKTWQRVLQGVEPLETVKSLLQPQARQPPKKTTTKSQKKARKKEKSKKSRTK